MQITAGIRSAAAIVVAIVVVVTACSASSGPASAVRRKAYRGPAARRGAHPLGAKWDWHRVDRLAPYLRTIAGGATFFELVWCDVEPVQGRRDWATLDRVLASTTRLGDQLGLKLRVGSCWATGGRRGEPRGAARKTPSALPTSLPAYRAFVRAAVARYAARGVHHWAIENEVNAEHSWDGTAADYRRLAETAAGEIRAADPQAVVLDSGIGSTAYGVALADRLLHERRSPTAVTVYGRYYTRRFSTRAEFPRVASPEALRVVLGSGAAKRDLAFLAISTDLARRGVVDAFQLHYYERPEDVPAVLGFLRARLAGRPVEAWEVGRFAPDGPSPRSSTAAGDAVRTAAGLLGGGVRRVIWLPLAYNPNGRHGTELRSGLVDPDGSGRPAAAAYRRLVDAARTGPTILAVERRGLRGTVFGDATRSVLVVWSLRGTRRLRVPPGGDAVDLAGHPIHASAAGVPVSRRPVFVTVPASPAVLARGLL